VKLLPVPLAGEFQHLVFNFLQLGFAIVREPIDLASKSEMSMHEHQKYDHQ